MTLKNQLKLIDLVFDVKKIVYGQIKKSDSVCVFLVHSRKGDRYQEQEGNERRRSSYRIYL